MFTDALIAHMGEELTPRVQFWWVRIISTVWVSPMLTPV